MPWAAKCGFGARDLKNWVYGSSQMDGYTDSLGERQKGVELRVEGPEKLG